MDTKLENPFYRIRVFPILRHQMPTNNIKVRSNQEWGKFKSRQQNLIETQIEENKVQMCILIRAKFWEFKENLNYKRTKN